ncbi:MAG: hypothetical protein MHM6MM_005968 [Cercozoa sp. M6MM]
MDPFLPRLVGARRWLQCAPGTVLVSADYTQVELRMMAHLSGDEALCRQCTDLEADVFVDLARQFFALPVGASVGEDQRGQAKKVFYGILYGLGRAKLAAEIGVSETAAAALTRQVRQQYPQLYRFRDELNRGDRKCTTLFGRVRPLKSDELRKAFNSCVQGSVADLVKLAMVRTDAALRKSGTGATLVHMIHDELLCETPVGHVDTATRILREQMLDAVRLRVPLQVRFRRGCSFDAMRVFH